MENFLLTREGVEKLKQELENLIYVIRPEVISELQAARAHGDLSENADYDAARARQAQVESRIKELENMLSNAEIIDETSGMGSIVRLGSTVKIVDLSDKKKYTYTIVGSVEADPKNGKISNLSPLAQAIIGKQEGSTSLVRVRKPYEVKIEEIVK